MVFRFPITAAFALMLVALDGRSAVAFCVLGYGDSLECRFVAACKKIDPTRAYCTCQFEFAKQAFPPEQLPTVVDVIEAGEDETRQQLIIARLGVGAMEFRARVNAVAHATATQCKR